MRCYLSIGALVCSVVAVTAHACLWDRDTLAAEARGLPGITEVITGRFDRFPPLFYEMRLERVGAEVEAEPYRLDLYDDAGVACDRLGRSDEAIAWMEWKLSVLERLESEGVDVSEHRYRYLANLGTFHIHRWLKGGQDREDMGDVERARELIAAAIELNPQAHFGRERYQLLAIEWILDPPRGESVGHSILHKIPKYRMYPIGSHGDRLVEFGYLDAAEGFMGLIALGNAWESIDIYTALAFALADSENQVLATLCTLRVQELADMGKISLHSDLVNVAELRTPGFAEILPEYSVKLDNYYIDARVESISWVDARNEYALARLESGNHPDTDSQFWDDWIEPSSAPDFPAMSTLSHNPQIGVLLVLGGVGLAAIFLLSGLIWLTMKAWSSLRS